MTGSQVFRHAWKMIFNDVRATVLNTLPPFLGAILIVFLLFGMDVFQTDIDVYENGNEQMFAELMQKTLYASLITMLGSILMVISWHRYVLLEEGAHGLLNAARRFVPYFLRVIILMIVSIISIVPIALGVVALSVLPLGIAVPIGILSGLFFLVYFMAFAFRVSLILPAAAIGHPFTLGDAWSQSSGQSVWFYLSIALWVGLVAAALGLVSYVVGLVSHQLGLFANFGVQYFTAILYAGTLTTLFGVFIQGRSLSL